MDLVCLLGWCVAFTPALESPGVLTVSSLKKLYKCEAPHIPTTPLVIKYIEADIYALIECT
jgi:hypothetical protein